MSSKNPARSIAVDELFHKERGFHSVSSLNRIRGYGEWLAEGGISGRGGTVGGPGPGPRNAGLGGIGGLGAGPGNRSGRRGSSLDGSRSTSRGGGGGA